MCQRSWLERFRKERDATLSSRHSSHLDKRESDSLTFRTCLIIFLISLSWLTAALTRRCTSKELSWLDSCLRYSTPQYFNIGKRMRLMHSDLGKSGGELVWNSATILVVTKCPWRYGPVVTTAPRHTLARIYVRPRGTVEVGSSAD